MEKKLHISKELALPRDAVTSTIVVYGGKGMGKTNLASVLVEEFAFNGLRFAVVDPMGVWWGLRHDADGRGAGIEAVIFGGIHGDLPIEPTSGGDVADFVADEDASVIVDISRRPDGSMWSIAERVRFVTAYAKRLYQRQGEKRRPIMQVIDEAARFAPQIVRQGESEVAACMGAIAVLVEEGRNVGIGVTLVTQRSARLNKDVAELADCMIAFRIVGPNSMRAVLDWLGEYVDKARIKEIGEQLRSLPRGSALVISPGWLEYEGIVAMRKRKTFDSSKTPEAGKDVRATGTGAKPDLAKYRQRFARTIEDAKANDPKALKARVAELERELARAEAAAGDDMRSDYLAAHLWLTQHCIPTRKDDGTQMTLTDRVKFSIEDRRNNLSQANEGLRAHVEALQLERNKLRGELEQLQPLASLVGDWEWSQMDRHDIARDDRLAEMWTHAGDCRAVWGVVENLDPVGNLRFRCSIFRNETPWLSSDLVREATTLTLDRWRRRFGWLGAPPLSTEVDPGKVRRKRDPGRCFRKAGWTVVGESRGLVVLEAPRD